ncbi:MAG: hypothetical protein H0X29_07395 [Parachlamydiaceae bacterium]|nr:hypothetical protein [Parachlamydiaceae bacterium]
MAEKKDVILNEMNAVLDLLIENAQKLNELSLQVIAEEEISPLQAQQQELLSALVELDNAFHQADSLAEEKISAIQAAVNDKIENFQQLNSNFMENIINAHGLIQFKDGKAKKTKKIKSLKN